MHPSGLLMSVGPLALSLLGFLGIRLKKQRTQVHAMVPFKFELIAQAHSISDMFMYMLTYNT